MLAIQKYILENGLDKALKTFNLKIRVYNTKILLKYDQLSPPTLMAKPEVQECRGLILERDTWKVMSMGFSKFFNSEEGNAHKIDWNTARILEKLDGTLIQVYFDWNSGQWHAATTGTAEGEGEVNNKMGTTFNDLFWNTIKEKYNLDSSKFKAGFTYCFELTTPYNIVVKPHGESSATLLMVRNLETLAELDFTQLEAISAQMGVPLVKTYDLSSKNVGALLKTFETMVWHDEGYVVVDANFNRVKVKNPAYVAVHHTKNKTAEHHILEIVKTNEVEEYIAVFPDRKDELYKLKANYDKLIGELNTVWDELQSHKPKNITPQEKKKFAAAVFDVSGKYGKQKFTGLFFGLADGKVSSVEDFMMNYDDKSLYKML